MKPDLESPYALSQYAGKRYCRIFTKLCGFGTVCLKYFNVFGPVMPQVISIQRWGFIKLVREGKRANIYGDVEASRDFIYVSNVVSANLLVCEAGGAGERYNIVSGESEP